MKSSSHNFTFLGLLIIMLNTKEIFGDFPILNLLQSSETRKGAVLPEVDHPLIVNNVGASRAVSVQQHRVGTNDVSAQWNSNAQDFPHVWTQKEMCKRPGGSYDNWICDPDEILTVEERSLLNQKIGDILNCKKCACDKQCRTSPAPYGKYSITIALLREFTDPQDTPLKLIEYFTTALRDTRWATTQRCTDGVFLSLNIGDRTFWTATGAVASQELTDSKIENINEKVKKYLENNEWFNYFNEKLDLIGDELPGQCGLSAGQIAGIVIGCLLGVAMIIGLILCCVGFFQNWECVVGTCGGVCIGCLLGAMQAFVNALIFQCVRNMCDSLGCGDCNPCGDCEPFSCVDDLEAGGGGGDF